MRVVVSVGGSVLVPELGAERVEAYAEVLLDVVESGHELGVVVGGGPVAREYIGTARALGADEISLDRLGIEVTRLNARLLAGALGDAAVSRPVEAVENAREVFRRGDIPVLGGTTPGHTTDAVATGVAEHAGADLLVYATSVDGVFDADPGVEKDAAKFDRLSPTELVEVVSEAPGATRRSTCWRRNSSSGRVSVLSWSTAPTPNTLPPPLRATTTAPTSSPKGDPTPAVRDCLCAVHCTRQRVGHRFRYNGLGNP